MELSQHQTWTELATRSHNNNGEGGILVWASHKLLSTKDLLPKSLRRLILWRPTRIHWCSRILRNSHLVWHTVPNQVTTCSASNGRREMRFRGEQIKPRKGNKLVVGIVARISGGQNQKELSLDDQVDHAKSVVSELFDGSVEYRVIKTTAKGERLDRPELQQLEDLLKSRELDLLIAEDIGRIVRGTAAERMCGIAVDHGTRVIAPNDCFDTADLDWEGDAISACRDHVGHNSHVSKRLKQKLNNRFKKFGGATSRPIFGYEVPETAKTFDDWLKDPDAVPIVSELLEILRATKNCSYAADWLNERNVPTGPYVRKTSRWTGRLTRQWVRNPLIKGVATRGVRHTVKIHETGRRVAVKNPAGPLHYPCPHLAYLTEDEFAELNADLDAKNSKLGRKPVDGRDPREGIPKCRTRWPGQCITCGVCGQGFVWGGHGVTDHMMCTGSRQYTCWNSATFDGVTGAKLLTAAVLGEIERLPEFDTVLVERVRKNVRQARDGREAELARATRELAQIEQSLKNVGDAIAKVGVSETLEEKLTELTLARRNCRERLEQIKKWPTDEVALPPIAQIKQQAREKLLDLAATSMEFHAAMRQLVPTIEVFPVRCVDGGAIVLRARLVVELASLIDLPGEVLLDEQSFRRTVEIDLFEPPQRVRFREQVVQMRASGMTERKVAATLGLTITAAQRAAELDRLMRSRSITDPYERITSPPSDSKWKRHLHPRYKQTGGSE